MAAVGGPGGGTQPSPDGDAWLNTVAAAAASASGAPSELLGEYLPMLAHAARNGGRPQSWELEAVRESGRQAARRGVGASAAVDLYLSAAWRMWRRLPLIARSQDPETVRSAAEAVLRVLDDAVGALVDGHTSERRDMIRHEEAQRAVFIDDLLRGDADVAQLVERAEPFGIDLGQSHHVALATLREGTHSMDRAAIELERAVIAHFGDRDVLVAIKDGRLVAVVPAQAVTPSGSGDAAGIGAVIERALRKLSHGKRWRVTAGRAFPGAYGVGRSYEEAREALVVADRLGLDADVVQASELLLYRVLGRDQAAIVDLIRDVLGPLEQVRGGPAVLLETLSEYFTAGDVATEAARRLHVSVRTVTYRLTRVAQLTGYDVAQPEHRFTLHTAVLGARLFRWPTDPLPSDT